MRYIYSDYKAESIDNCEEIAVVYPTHKIIKTLMTDPELIQAIKNGNIAGRKWHAKRIEIMRQELDELFPEISPELRAEYEDKLGFNKPFVPQDEEYLERTIPGEYSDKPEPVIIEYHL